MIWLASFPRSGNTFFRNVLHEVYGLTSSTYHQDPSRKRDENFADHPVVKTHLLPDQLPQELQKMPAVYLIRDGRDALVSIAHHRKDIVAPGTDFYNNLLEATLAQNGSFFGGWSENVRQWTERAAIVIRFEDLIADPIREVEKLRSIISLPEPDLRKLPTFQSLRNGRPAYGGGEGDSFDTRLNKKHFRSGKIGSWKKEATPELQRLVNNMHGETLQRFGYVNEKTVSPPKKRRGIIEASKLFTTDNDGVKRYLVGLRQGLTTLLPHFPYLEVQLANDNKGYFEVSPWENNQRDEFKVLTEKEKILSNQQIMGYEKRLILFKISLRKVLPSRIYVMASKYYRAGPFRSHLKAIQNFVKKIKLRISGESFANSVETADLFHVPLPQHLAKATSSCGKTLLTVHDFSHRLFPDYHEKANIDFAEQGMQQALEKDAHFLSVSTATQQDLITLYKPEIDRLYQIPEAANTTQFNRRAKKTDAANIHQQYGIPSAPYLMCLSTIEPRKNLGNTVRAFLQLKKEHPDLACSLVICGKKGWKTENIFAGLDIDRPDIIFTGFVNDEDLPVLYAHARALCYVSIYEGFGLPIVEAMACGTPVIFGDNSSQPEVAGDGGIAVAADDVPGITAAMHRMITDDEFRTEKAEAAWRQANKFSWLKTALLTLDTYEKILNEPA